MFDSGEVELPDGADPLIAAVDFLANVRLLPLAGDNRWLATAAKVRLVHGAPSAGPVGIYFSVITLDDL